RGVIHHDAVLTVGIFDTAIEGGQESIGLLVADGNNTGAIKTPEAAWFNGTGHHMQAREAGVKLQERHDSIRVRRVRSNEGLRIERQIIVRSRGRLLREPYSFAAKSRCDLW